jgi:hypothetical protein
VVFGMPLAFQMNLLQRFCYAKSLRISSFFAQRYDFYQFLIPSLLSSLIAAKAGLAFWGSFSLANKARRLFGMEKRR